MRARSCSHLSVIFPCQGLIEEPVIRPLRCHSTHASPGPGILVDGIGNAHAQHRQAGQDGSDDHSKPQEVKNKCCERPLKKSVLHLQWHKEVGAHVEHATNPETKKPDSDHGRPLHRGPDDEDLTCGNDKDKAATTGVRALRL